MRTSILRRASKRSSRLSTGGVIAVAALGVTALLVRRAARKAERRNPPTGQFIDVEGVRLHYIEMGEGDPVVLLHGNGDFARDFVASGLMDQLARRYRVIAFDRPGFGYSERPRLRIWTPTAQAKLLLVAMSRLGAYQPIVLGHSWGAMVAVACALQSPDTIRGLLLMGGYLYPTPQLAPVLLSGPAIPVIGDVMRYTISPLLAWMVSSLMRRRAFAPQPVPSAFKVEVPTSMMLRPWQLRASAAEWAMLIPAAAMLSRHYRELRVPMTVISGSGDGVVDYRAHSLRLHRELPQSRLQVLAGLGHMPHYFAPEQLTAAVDELMSRSVTPVVALAEQEAGLVPQGATGFDE